MRKDSWEIYSGIRVRAPIMVRADGRGFRKVLESFDKPYDIDFARCLVGAARRFFENSGLSPALAFAFSDEVNVLFMEVPFNGRLEKVDSVISGFLSAALSLSLGTLVTMDSRSIPMCSAEIVDYLSGCQNETWRNYVFSYGFYSLVSDGMTGTEAMKILRGMREGAIHEMLFQRGVNLAKNPAWERRGVLVYRNADEVVVDNWDLPLFKTDEGAHLLEDILTWREKKGKTSDRK